MSDKVFVDALENKGTIGTEVLVFEGGEQQKSPKKMVVIRITDKMLHLVTDKAFASKSTRDKFNEDSYLNGYEKRYPAAVVINTRKSSFSACRKIWQESIYINKITELEAQLNGKCTG